MNLAEYGAETAPPITTPEVSEAGIECCPSCEAKLDRVEADTLDLPVSRLRADRVADVFRAVDVRRVRSWGEECPVCGAMFPATVSTPAAAGWPGYIGTTVRRADGTAIRVPTRIEDFPKPLLLAIHEVFSR